MNWYGIQGLLSSGVDSEPAEIVFCSIVLTHQQIIRYTIRYPIE